MIVGPSFDPVAGWVWRDAIDGVEVRFAGKGPAGGPERRRLEAWSGHEAAPAAAWCTQVHSAEVLPATQPGDAGEGDALVSGEAGLALSVVTADCVPVLLAAGDALAAVHAGWRGVVQGVVPAAVEALRARGGNAPLRAWVGPAIGSCCYEVGDEVAEQVVAVSEPAVRSRGPSGKAHVDLPWAAIAQLRRAGVAEIRPIPLCTRCEVDWLWSYRREGTEAGRNHAFIWRA